MTNADCSSVNIHLLVIQIQDLHVGKSNDTKRFVDLPQCNILRPQSGGRQQLGYSQRRCNCEINRSGGGIGKTLNKIKTTDKNTNNGEEC